MHQRQSPGQVLLHCRAEGTSFDRMTRVQGCCYVAGTCIIISAHLRTVAMMQFAERGAATILMLHTCCVKCVGLPSPASLRAPHNHVSLTTRTDDTIDFAVQVPAQVRFYLKVQQSVHCSASLLLYCYRLPTHICAPHALLFTLFALLRACWVATLVTVDLHHDDVLDCRPTGLHTTRGWLLCLMQYVLQLHYLLPAEMHSEALRFVCNPCDHATCCCCSIGVSTPSQSTRCRCHSLLCTILPLQPSACATIENDAGH
jgi:hypothetical protein